MIGKLASSTTIAIGLIVLVGMYILYRDMKKLECSIESYSRVLHVLRSYHHRLSTTSKNPTTSMNEDDEQEEIIEQAATTEAADTEIEDAVNQLKKEVMSEEQDVAIEDL
jgi:biopolymer transport protein ExbB/TolQ